VVGAWTQGRTLTGGNGLARLDPRRNRVHHVTPLPSGQLATAFGEGALWVARVGGSSVERIDPSTGRVSDLLHAKAGSALAFAGGRLWTADRNGTIRRL
jgi:streptogramin lyase